MFMAVCCLIDDMSLKFCKVIATIPKNLKKNEKNVNFPIGNLEGKSNKILHQSPNIKLK
jgi:hypothetical protein